VAWSMAATRNTRPPSGVPETLRTPVGGVKWSV
jgi:hypothetical protein